MKLTRVNQETEYFTIVKGESFQLIVEYAAPKTWSFSVHKRDRLVCAGVSIPSEKMVKSLAENGIHSWLKENKNV